MAQTATATTAPAPKVWGGGRSPFNVSYGKMMMWFFLMSDALTFGAFLISYGAQRFKIQIWPDANTVYKSFPFVHIDAAGVGLPLVFVSLMTFILIVSSVTMVLAVHAGHYNNKKGVIKWMLLTIIGGIAFLSCQAWEWTHLAHETGGLWGTFTDKGSAGMAAEFFKSGADRTFAATHPALAIEAAHNFYNFFFTITGFHGFHVLSGVVFLIIILINAINGTYERRGHYEMVEKVGLYWHFVDLVWVFVFTCFYLL